MLPEVHDDELAELYAWVDTIPFTRSKKHIARDFADGVSMAELVHHYFPKLVELHNYSPASNSSQKVYNWTTLNQKVFRRLGFTLPKELCQSVAFAEQGTIERILKLVRFKLAQYQARNTTATPSIHQHLHPFPTHKHPAHTPSRYARTPPVPGSNIATPPPPSSTPLPSPSFILHEDRLCGDAPSLHGNPKIQTPNSMKTAADAERVATYQEKNDNAPQVESSSHHLKPLKQHNTHAQQNKLTSQYICNDENNGDGQELIPTYHPHDPIESLVSQLRELRAVNEVLESKAHKMEQLLRLKDAKIAALTARLQSVPSHALSF